MVDASLRATILESLVKLKRELGISLIYITHDLTTAYQVSQNIYVLYRGSVAEVGSVEQGHQGTRNTRTRACWSAPIPLPDPDIHWGGGESGADVKRSTVGSVPVRRLQVREPLSVRHGGVSGSASAAVSHR